MDIRIVQNNHEFFGCEEMCRAMVGFCSIWNDIQNTTHNFDTKVVVCVF